MTTEIDTTTTEEITEEAREAARLEALAELALPALFKTATDDELRQEHRRVSRLFERPVRVWAIGHSEALERLDRGLRRLPQAADEALARVRRECVESASGPTSTTLAQALLLIEVCKPHGYHREKLEAALAVDGKSIAEGDPRAEQAARRRAWDERRTAIGRELERRNLLRRGLISTTERSK